jgi:DNA-directed RNA polymerase specialized sigma24 family protein
MPDESRDEDISREQFDQLLGWLHPDRAEAGVKYECIRKRLIKFFVCRGSNVPEELADKTINRVARKLPEIVATYVGDPAHYFCGVAGNIFREALRNDKPPVILPPRPAPPDDETEREYACLEKCMAKLNEEERDLVIAYYQRERQAKIDHRKKLAERLGKGLNALRIQACRIRARLQECVLTCLKEEAIGK